MLPGGGREALRVPPVLCEQTADAEREAVDLPADGPQAEQVGRFPYHRAEQIQRRQGTVVPTQKGLNVGKHLSGRRRKEHAP